MISYDTTAKDTRTATKVRVLLPFQLALRSISLHLGLTAVSTTFYTDTSVHDDYTDVCCTRLVYK